MLKIPKHKIKVEISSFDSNRWIYFPRTRQHSNEKIDNRSDIEGDPFPLMYFKEKVLHWSIMGVSKMDSQIVQNGLKVLECNRQLKSKRELEKKKRHYRQYTMQTLDRLERQQRQQGVKIEKNEQNIMKC
jgi:hypothetical protein